MPLILHRARFSFRISIITPLLLSRQNHCYTMTPPPSKRQKRVAKDAAATQLSEEKNDNNNGEIKMPKKKFYRQRAHANPFSDHRLDYPSSPAHMNWSPHYPAFVDPDSSKINLSGARKLLKDVEVVDIGCGFGGLLVGLAPLMPDTLLLGMEIRTQVLDYVRTRVRALRYQQSQLKNSSASSTSQPQEPTSSEQQPGPDPSATSDDTPTTVIPGNYENISAIRSNTMKFLPNFFARSQLSKIFICFPDPHFKMRKHKARIISETLNAEYAYVLRPGGLMYTITDVEEYHHWILRHFRQEKSVAQEDGSAAGETETGTAGDVTDLFERVSEEELERDPCVQVMKEATEEGKKVTRNKGHKFVAVFRRKADPEWSA